MRTVLYLLLALSLCSCDSVVSEQDVGQPVWSNQILHSTKTSVCYACGMGMNGKFECSFGLHMNCSCAYKADVLTQNVETHWKSGRTTQDTRMVEKKNETTCN